MAGLGAYKECDKPLLQSFLEQNFGITNFDELDQKITNYTNDSFLQANCICASFDSFDGSDFSGLSHEILSHIGAFCHPREAINEEGLLKIAGVCIFAEE